MTLNEIYVLNRAIDGAEIYALPKLNIPLSDFLISSVKDKLVEKRILNTHKSFTDEGIRLTQRIRLYKTAVKYISINRITIGLQDENNGVALIYNPYFNSYAFDKIFSEDIFSCLTETYPFLQEDGEAVSEHEQEESIAFDLLKERHHIDHKKSLIVKTKSKDVETHEELYFANNQFYLYDHIRQILIQKSKEKLIDIIRERMKIHGQDISSS